MAGTPDELRVRVKGGLWRFHPERKIVEVLTYGTANPWGHDWDANGECFFINTVTGHLWHLITSAVVSAECRLSMVTTKDGRELSGIVKARTARTVTLRTMTDEQAVELSEVTKEDVSTLSMMPEGLLPPEHVRDSIG